MDLERTGRLAGRYRWIEDRLFEAMGSWARSPGDARLQEHWAVQSQRHAWHAELWQQRLPQVPGLRLDDELASPGAVDFVAELVGPDGDDAALERLVGTYRVLLPRLVGAYLTHLDAISGLTDAPTARVLGLVLRDEQEAWVDGERLIQALVTTPELAGRASAHQGRLEALLVGAEPWRV